MRIAHKGEKGEKKFFSPFYLSTGLFVGLLNFQANITDSVWAVRVQQECHLPSALIKLSQAPCDHSFIESDRVIGWDIVSICSSKSLPPSGGRPGLGRGSAQHVNVN
jgi:hypothetical protein